MECVEGALKTSLRSEIGLRLNPQGGLEDSFQNVATCDDDFVDDLLNFANDDGEDEDRLVNDVVEQNDKECKRNDNFVLAFDEKCSHPHHHNSNHPPTELTVPADELANLEWLSHFVEDSFSVHSTTPFLSSGASAENLNKPKPDTPVEPGKTPGSDKSCFTTPIPAKARSKRTRTGGCVWSLGSPSFTESSSASSSSSSSSSPSSPWVVYAIQSQEPAGSVEKPAPKKYKKRPTADSTGSGSGPGLGQLARRCSHCGVQKTPQWRAGPLGAKTLCNACGVRFKSGRLFPEYRPACSPTFSSELHSNHHRKVLEMRGRKSSV